MQNDGNDSHKQHCCRLFKTSQSDSFPSHLTQPIYECTNPDFKLYKADSLVIAKTEIT